MKRFLLVLLCTVWAYVAWAQPANDDCSNATPITNLDDGGSCFLLSGEDNTGATVWTTMSGTFTGGCWAGATPGVVFYSFTAQGVSGSVEVTGGPAGEDALVSVITFGGAACNSAASEVGCTNGGIIEFDSALVVGQVYYVVVGFTNSAEGLFDLCVYNPVPAPNDECANAIELTELDGSPCNNNLTNYYPSSENVVPACFGPDTYTVWYSFTAQGVSIADLHVDGNVEDANVAVWDFNNGGSCSNLGAGTLLVCETGVDANNPIVLDNDLVIGNTYYVVVSFNNNSTAENFSICLDNPEPAVNDFCADALEFPQDELDQDNCLTTIQGELLSNDWPSTDLFTPGCWGNQFTYSVWFYFTAQGPDVDIDVSSFFGEDAQIALVEFQGGPACTAANAVVIECEPGPVMEVDDVLEIDNIYYVMVGFDNNGVGDYCIDIFNPIPPDNDTVCAAIMLPTDGSCNAGPPCVNDCYTTEYANPEFNPNQFPAECQPYVENTVWFTIEMDDPNNVGFEIELTEGTGSDFTVVIGTFDDCNGNFQVEALYCDFMYPIEFGPVFDEDQVYYVMVGSSEDNEGTFTICVDEIEPCFDNNFCEDPMGVSSANEIPGVISNDPFVCVDGCNLFADPMEGTVGPSCPQNNDPPVVWFTVTTDAVASLMNIQVTSDDISAPTIQLYTGTSCASLNPVPQTNSNLLCVTGSQGEAIANGTTVSPNQVYYIAISGSNTVGGDFELCINTVEQASACVLDADIEITARSIGDDLEGPFFPGEIVSVCMNVNSYTASGNGCQWFQGLVPVFGNGWSPNSFDANGQPLNATLNGANFPANGVLNSSTWDWWTDVTYHHDNPFYQVGDFDGNGTLDMCSSLYDPDCIGPGLTGGAAPPCWTTTPGALLPPGWFAYGVTGLCPTDGFPTVDWGDGSGCGAQSGNWSFCFDLEVRPASECDQDQTFSDLTLAFFTFADGETGSWNGGPSVCALDQTVTSKPPMCCVEVQNEVVELDPFCSPGTFSFTADYNDYPGTAVVDFWEWTVDAGGVTGADPGSGPNGVTVINSLENTGASEELVTYNFLGFSGGDCPAIILEVSVIVYPQIEVEMTPFTVCATPNDPYEIVPVVTGGDPASYQFLWQDGSTEDTYEVTMPSPGTQYRVTVTDDAGCSGTATVVLDVYETFPVNIDAPILEQCLVDGPISLLATAEDGTPAYNFEWESPSGGSQSGSSVTADETGWWNVVATDSEGCAGEDSVLVEFFESPEVEVFPDQVAVCPDSPNPTQINALVTGGQFPYDYEWDTPGGISLSNFILATEVGTYSLLVTDNNGCTAELTFDVGASPTPIPDLGGSVQVCAEELQLGYELQPAPDPSFVAYEWSNGETGESIIIDTTGTYVITVTNDAGCEGTDEVTVDLYPEIVPDLPDTTSFCAGGFVIIEGDPQYFYDWSTGNSGNEIFIFDEQLLFVTVTDVNGCTIETEVQVLEEDFLIPDIIGDSVICNGVPVDITANDGFATYEWFQDDLNSAPISDEQSIMVTEGGWYYIEVSDGDGCFGTDSVLVIESAPSVAINGDPVICEGDSSTLDVGSWADIEWSTGDSTSTITTDTAGTFEVTITDQYGCQNNASFQVAASATPDPQISGSTSFCTGSSTTLDAGAGYASYLWSTTETTQTIAVNTTSTIYLTVTNADGCEGFDTISVIESASLTPNISGDTVVCNNNAVTLDAGTGFTSYEWSTTETSQTISVSTAGSYVVTVTDAQGCTGTDQVTVLAGNPAPTIAGDASVCSGSTGSIAVESPAQYAEFLWSTGETTASINVDSSAVYSVTVTDQLGCTGETTWDFAVNPNPNPNIQGSLTYCVGGSTTLNVGSFAQVLWSTSETTTSIQVTTPGTYSVTVTDANGCTGTDQVDVMESTELVLNVQDTAICEGESVVLEVGSFASYQWSNSETTATIEVNSGGAYSVTVTDVSGCTGSATITVNEYPQPFADVTPNVAVCNTTADGSVVNFDDLITGGDTGGSWVDVDNSGASGAFPLLDFDGIAPGQYQFEYTTNSATPPCEDVTYTATVNVQDCACPSPGFMAPAPLCSDDDILDLSTLEIAGVTAPGGTWSLLSSGATNPPVLNGTILDASGADPGTYQIQYSLTGLPAGCVDTSVQDVVVNAPPQSGIALAPAQICVGEDTTIALSAMLDNADAGGAWVETSADMSVAGFDDVNGTFNTAIEIPGTYTFDYIVSGTAPCPDAVTTVSVVIEDVPVADAGDDRTLTCDIREVQIGGPGTSMGPDFEYLWTTTDGALSDSLSDVITVKNSGTYTLTVRNTATGCESYDDVFVDVDGNIPTDVVYDLRFPICEGETPASLTVETVTGGTPPYTYSLNGGTPSASPDFTDLSPGAYTLTVEDAQGCAIESDFSIPAPTSVDGSITGEFVVNLGAEAVLTYVLTAGIADSLIWMDADGNVLCVQCDTLRFVPETNIDVFLTIYDENLCNVTLSAPVRIISKKEVFVPNVFSPNNDGVNDFVTVYGPPGVLVENLEIFTRWGELVYRKTGPFNANDPEQGWDGTFGGPGGDELMPGVYVFHASVTYPDGFEEVVKGDITLIK